MDAQTDIIAISYRASLCYFYVSYLNVLEVTLNTRHRRHSLISCCVSSCQCPLTTRSDRRAGRSTGPARKMIALFHPPRRTRRPLKLVARLIACRVAVGDETKHRAYVVGDDDRGCFHQSYCMSTRQGCRTRRTCRASDRRPP